MSGGKRESKKQGFSRRLNKWPIKLVHSVANVFVPFPSKRKFGCVRCKITLLTSRGNSMDIERGNENKWVHIVDTFSTPRFFSVIRDRTDGQSNEQDSKVRKTKRNTKKGLSMAGSRYRHVRPLSPMSRKMKRLVDHERLPDSGSTARLAKKRGRREGKVACSMESGETLGSRSETGMERGKGRGAWSVYDQFHGKTVIDRFLDFQTDQQTTLVSILLSCFPPLSFIRDTLNDGTSCTYNDRLPTFQSFSTCDTLPKKFSLHYISLPFFLFSFIPPSTNSAKI